MGYQHNYLLLFTIEFKYGQKKTPVSLKQEFSLKIIKC